MADIAIVTDSTSDLPPEIAERFGIEIVPLRVHVDDRTFLDRDELTTADFMQMLLQSNQLPTTSQPTPADFERVYRRLVETHSMILSIHISPKLSGTLQSATQAARSVADDISVEVVDSGSATMGLGMQVIRAAELAAADVPPNQIAEQLRSESSRYEVVFLVETLEFLRRGGRIGRAAELVGGILDLKPTLRLVAGEIAPLERTRTRKRAIRGLVNYGRSLNTVERLTVLYNSTENDAQRLLTEFDLMIPADQRYLAQLGPVIGTHVGPGALGIAIAKGPEER